MFDDKADRIQRAIIQRENMQSSLSKRDASAVFDYEIGPCTPMVDKSNAYATKAESIGLLDKVSTSSNYVGYTTINNNVMITVNQAHLKENEDQNILPSLLMPMDLTSSLVSTTPTSNGSSHLYASCGLWEFAGQKSSMLHQAFLTSSAIYLVVTDIADDISKQNVQ
ncbi:unnamed protein product [Mytilus coruscus]|uniref:Uncharacterized protein n=1 Tax=Mytilus coruscus TaxID=42192 RepID=A0A6J8DX63_MYTCO|nr:unnamed protein product [Mytilus coruscus]